MNGWADPEPAWWLNLRAHPDATVELPGGTRDVTASRRPGRASTPLGDAQRAWHRRLHGCERRPQVAGDRDRHPGAAIATPRRRQAVDDLGRDRDGALEGVADRQCFTPQCAISSSVAGSTPAAVQPDGNPTVQAVRQAPSSSIPRSPRSSDSESTVTSSVSRAMPSMAARIAISVATQLASAARRSQPGDGAVAVPPTDVTMSVEMLAPDGPSTRITSPSIRVAIAALSVDRASSGCFVR